MAPSSRFGGRARVPHSQLRGTGGDDVQATLRGPRSAPRAQRCASAQCGGGLQYIPSMLTAHLFRNMPTAAARGESAPLDPAQRDSLTRGFGSVRNWLSLGPPRAGRKYHILHPVRTVSAIDAFDQLAGSYSPGAAPRPATTVTAGLVATEPPPTPTVRTSDRALPLGSIQLDESSQKRHNGLGWRVAKRS